MNGGGAWEEGPDLFCFHFILGSNRRSVSDGDVSALHLFVQTQGGRVGRSLSSDRSDVPSLSVS